ncbi:MAG: histidinol-phosphate transaminase [Armatimonadetes bacterium]|nr:histidinol-phosphate transaminase [Armatimonadota bacterium]
MSQTIRPSIQTLPKYVAGKPIEEVQRELGLDRVVKLASNENPLGASPHAIAAMQEAVTKIHLYPDASGYELRHAIAKFYSLESNQVVLGNGSDELLTLLGSVYLVPGTEIIVGDPTFVRYNAAATITGAKEVRVPLRDDMTHDLPAMAKALTEKTRLVFLPNPHNPTGTVVKKAEVDAFLNDLPKGAMLVLDEAYVEYAADLPDFPNGLDYVKDGKPVIALRTFSKGYGLAGIRIGYGLASPEVIDAMDRARPPFNANAVAQAGAVAALEDQSHVAASRKVNQEGLDRVAKIAADMGLRSIPSAANFICVDVQRDDKEVFDELLKRGVIVRAGGPLGLPQIIRVSIGTREEMDIFESAFREVMAATALTS